MAKNELSTLSGNSPEQILRTWMAPGQGLAPSLLCPGGSVSIVKTAKEAVWSTALAALPRPPEGGEAHRRSWCVVAHKVSRFSVRIGLARLSGAIQVQLVLLSCDLAAISAEIELMLKVSARSTSRAWGRPGQEKRRESGRDGGEHGDRQTARQRMRQRQREREPGDGLCELVLH